MINRKTAGWLPLIVVWCSLLFTSGCSLRKLADLRDGLSLDSIDESKARTLLTKMADAHGASNWRKIFLYHAQFEDEFFGLTGKLGHPYKESYVKFSLTFNTKNQNGKLLFDSGKLKGHAWGIQQGKTYTKEPNRAAVVRADKDIAFWLPTYKYFIEFPARIQETTIATYVGTREIDGHTCEGILASWNQLAPQPDIDQYVIWVDAEHYQIVRIDYTIREQYKFLTGAVYFKDYKTFDGLLLPTRMPVTSNIKKNGWLHEMRLLSFVADKHHPRTMEL